jgi:hypothetical protein
MARDLPWMRTEATQENLRRLARAMCMEPIEGRRMWLSGCSKGDVKLPMTKGAVTAREAFECAWGWLAPELEGR